MELIQLRRLLANFRDGTITEQEKDRILLFLIEDFVQRKADLGL